MKKMISLLTFMAISNFSFGQAIQKEQKEASQPLRPSYYPPLSVTNSSVTSAGASSIKREYWWPDFYSSLRKSVPSKEEDKKEKSSAK